MFALPANQFLTPQKPGCLVHARKIPDYTHTCIINKQTNKNPPDAKL